MSKHHSLDPYPIPKDKTLLYINEPWLIDKSIYREIVNRGEPESEDDNIRVYIPLDLNKKAILRRLDDIIMRYGEVNERNESDFRMDVDGLISQVEIYDQIWYVRHMPENGRHSNETIELIKEFVARLEEISDGCAELFPFETIADLWAEYLSD